MRHLIKHGALPGVTPADLLSLRKTGWSCEACIYGKPYKTNTKGMRTRATSIGQLIHCDIFGPTQQPSIQGGYRYWITFVDDYTRRLWIYLLIERKHAVVAFKQFVNDFAAASRGVQALYYSVENYVPFIEHIRTDNAGEFVGAKSKFATFLRETGVAHEFSAPHVHQSNGVAERVNLSIANGVRTSLAQANLPRAFWGFAAIAYAHTHNHLPQRCNPGCKSAMTLWPALQKAVPNTGHAAHVRMHGILRHTDRPALRRRQIG